ncbi:MAG: ECF-type sigma factor [Bryobacteraceae bacterium]
MAELTVLLQRYRCGDRTALDEIMPLVYRELHGRAQRQIGREHGPVTLQPTALVHEAYLKLVGSDPPHARDRAHFLAIAARLMRQILVDHARGRKRAKRSPEALVSLDDSLTPAPAAAAVVELDDALQDLAGDNSRRAEIIELHYFGGLTAEESATALDLSVHMVRKEIRLGQAWLRRRLAQ